jgi:hypothetical protein
MTPKQAFSLDPNNAKDKPIIERVRENIKKSFSNKITINDYQEGQKVVLHNYVEKKTDSLVATKLKKKLSFKKGFFIPATVKKVYKSNVKLIIDRDSLITKSMLSKGETYKVGLDLIKIVSEHDWTILM